MAQITKEIIVDVAKKNLFQAIIAKQNDNNSRFLKVTLCNEGTKIEVPSNATVLINAERADDGSKAFAGTVNEDGTVTVPLTNWMLELDDIVRCSISIINPDREKLTSTSFSVEVESAETLSSGISEDENYDILVRLISDTSNAKLACETATMAANSATEKANTATTAAQEAAEKAAQEVDNLLSTKENVSNKIDDIDTECTDEQYPSAIAVKNYLYDNYYDASDTEDRFQFKLEAGDNVTIEKAGMYTSAEKISVNLDSKYDASNVETGSGELTVYSEDMPIPSATFAYQRTGDFVTVALSIEFSQAEMGKTKSYQFLGLPYKNDIATRQATITNNKNKLTVAIGVGTSTLTVLTQGEAVSFSQKEFITDTITYKIRK